MSNRNLTIGVVLAIVIAVAGLFSPVLPNGKSVFGSVNTSCGGSTTCLSDLYLNTVAGGTGSLQVAGTTVMSGAASVAGLFTTTAGQLHGYAVATTTIGSSETLRSSDIAAYDTVILSPNVAGNTTLTFFASSTAAAWLPTAGNTQHVCFLNATTTAGAIYTLVGGTGTTLLVASSSATALGAVTIYPQKVGCFDFIRGNTTATTFDLIGAFTAFN